MLFVIYHWQWNAKCCRAAATSGVLLHAGLVQESALEHKRTGLVAHHAFRDAHASQVSKTAGLLPRTGSGTAHLPSNCSSEDSSPLIKAVVGMAGLGSSKGAAGGKMQAAISLASHSIPAIGEAVVSSVVSTVIAGAGELSRLCCPNCVAQLV